MSYHEGELSVQHKLGVATNAQNSGRMMSNRIPARAIDFIAQQPMLIIGSTDKNGKVWASALFGEPGFIRSKDPYILELDMTPASLVDSDPLWQNIQDNPYVGMLVIELGSRRRLRVNGRITPRAEKLFRIDIDQAYPNCPKYIQRRHVAHVNNPGPEKHSNVSTGEALTPQQQLLITQADTFFVASSHPEHGTDASHRGGLPGFIKVCNEKRLRIPDYPGNNMFNTLGNFQINPQAGLVFIDFDNKKRLQLTGSAQVLWHIDDTEQQTGDTSRYWDFSIESWHENDIAVDIEWEYLDASPYNPTSDANEK